MSKLEHYTMCSLSMRKCDANLYERDIVPYTQPQISKYHEVMVPITGNQYNILACGGLCRCGWGRPCT